MTTHRPDDHWDPNEMVVITHPDHPLVDDDSAVALEDATVDLTLRRSPLGLGDGLADLHAMVSLRAQLHDRIPLAVASACRQGHSWGKIAASSV